MGKILIGNVLVGKVLAGNTRWAKYLMGNATGRQSTIDRLDVQEGMHKFMGSYSDILSHHEVQVQDLLSASSNFIEVFWPTTAQNQNR